MEAHDTSQGSPTPRKSHQFKDINALEHASSPKPSRATVNVWLDRFNNASPSLDSSVRADLHVGGPHAIRFFILTSIIGCRVAGYTQGRQL